MELCGYLTHVDDFGRLVFQTPYAREEKKDILNTSNKLKKLPSMACIDLYRGVFYVRCPKGEGPSNDAELGPLKQSMCRILVKTKKFVDKKNSESEPICYLMLISINSM